MTTEVEANTRTIFGLTFSPYRGNPGMQECTLPSGSFLYFTPEDGEWGVSPVCSEEAGWVTLDDEAPLLAWLQKKQDAQAHKP